MIDVHGMSTEVNLFVFRAIAECLCEGGLQCVEDTGGNPELGQSFSFLGRSTTTNKVECQRTNMEMRCVDKGSSYVFIDGSRRRLKETAPKGALTCESP